MEEEFPAFHKVTNGHTMEVFPATGPDGEVEEVVFWCHVCDPNGQDIVTLPALDGLVSAAYLYLLDQAEKHAEDIEVIE